MQASLVSVHVTAWHCNVWGLTDHVALNFNNNASTAAVFLDIKSDFDTTWHSGLLYKLSKLEFSTSLIKLISSFLSQHKFRVSVQREMSTPREIQAGVPQGSILSPTLYNMYISDVPKASGAYLAIFANDISLYVTDRKNGFVVRKLQCSLSSTETWCECWNIKINEVKTQGIYFYHRRRLSVSHLTRMDEIFHL
jgi:hypothetical protein